MSKKYLDYNGLLYFWQKLKAYFALKVHTHSDYENVQADWNQTTTTADDYIKNKPTIPSGVVVDSDLSTTSENAVQNKVITTALNKKAVGSGRIFYGTCSTAAGTAAKAVTCSSYDALTTGDVLIVKFTYTPTVESTLNVNSKGAKACRKIYNGYPETLVGGDIIAGLNLFMYDGTYWILISTDTDTTYSIGDSSDLTTGTSQSSKIWAPKVLHDYVVGAIETAVTGAASFQGTAPTTFAPTNYKKGYYWVVGTAGTYVGETCEPGDMIFAVADYNSAYSASDFNVIQTNLDITDISNSDIDTIVAS